jgi:hypothetical protein
MPVANGSKKEVMAAEALAHTIRVRVLEVLNERDMSAVGFANEGYAGEPDERVLSSVAYHFRALAKVGAIVPIKRRRVRGPDRGSMHEPCVYL